MSSALVRAKIVKSLPLDTSLLTELNSQLVAVERRLYEVELCDGYRVVAEAPSLTCGVSEEYSPGSTVYVAFETYNTGTIIAKVSDPPDEFYGSPPTLEPYRLPVKGTVFEGKADEDRPVMLHDPRGGYVAVKEGQIIARTVGRTYVFLSSNSANVIAPYLSISSTPQLTTEELVSASPTGKHCPYKISNEGDKLVISVLADDLAPVPLTRVSLGKESVSIDSPLAKAEISTSGITLDSKVAKVEIKASGDVAVQGKSITLGALADSLVKASFLDTLVQGLMAAASTAGPAAGAFTQLASTLQLRKALVTTKITKAG